MFLFGPLAVVLEILKRNLWLFYLFFRLILSSYLNTVFALLIARATIFSKHRNPRAYIRDCAYIGDCAIIRIKMFDPKQFKNLVLF